MIEINQIETAEFDPFLKGRKKRRKAKKSRARRSFPVFGRKRMAKSSTLSKSKKKRSGFLGLGKRKKNSLQDKEQKHFGRPFYPKDRKSIKQPAPPQRKRTPISKRRIEPIQIKPRELPKKRPNQGRSTPIKPLSIHSRRKVNPGLKRRTNPVKIQSKPLASRRSIPKELVPIKPLTFNPVAIPKKKAKRTPHPAATTKRKKAIEKEKKTITESQEQASVSRAEPTHSKDQENQKNQPPTEKAIKTWQVVTGVVVLVGGIWVASQFLNPKTTP